MPEKITRTGEEIIKDFENKVLELRRDHYRRLFWFDVFLCALVILTIVGAIAAITLFKP